MVFFNHKVTNLNFVILKFNIKPEIQVTHTPQ